MSYNRFMATPWEQELAELDAHLDELAQALQAAVLMVDLAESREANPRIAPLAQQVRRALRAVGSLRLWRKQFKRTFQERGSYGKG